MKPVMPSATLKSVLAITACALGAVAAQDALAQIPAAVAQEAATQTPATAQIAQGGVTVAQEAATPTPATAQVAQGGVTAAQITQAPSVAQGDVAAAQIARGDAAAQRDTATAQITQGDAISAPYAQMLGAVHTQGAIFRPEPADPSYPLNQIGTLASCFTAANGWLQDADLSRVHILRAPLTDSTADIQPEIINFRNFLERGRREYNTAIYAGDTVYVPLRDASDADNVRVIREIRDNPSYYYPGNFYYPPRPAVYIIQPQPPRYHPSRPPRPKPRPPVVITPPPAQPQPRPPVVITPPPAQPQPRPPVVITPPSAQPVEPPPPQSVPAVPLQPAQPHPQPNNPPHYRQPVRQGQRVQVARPQSQPAQQQENPDLRQAPQAQPSQQLNRPPQRPRPTQQQLRPPQPSPQLNRPQQPAPRPVQQFRQAGPR